MIHFRDLNTIPFIISNKKIKNIFITLFFIHIILFGLGLFYFSYEVNYINKISQYKLDNYDCIHLAKINTATKFNIDYFTHNFDWIYDYNYINSNLNITNYLNTYDTTPIKWDNCYHETYDTCIKQTQQKCLSHVHNISNLLHPNLNNNYYGFTFNKINQCFNKNEQEKIFVVKSNGINEAYDFFMNELCIDNIPKLYCNPWKEYNPPYMCSKKIESNYISSIAKSFAIIEMCFNVLIIIISTYYKNTKHKRKRTIIKVVDLELQTKTVVTV
jgi:hypothetical protein